MFYGETPLDVFISLLPILIPLFLLQLVLMITALISLAKKPLSWNDKLGWLILILLVTTIGPVIYFAVGANMLEQKIAQTNDQEEGL